MVIRVIKRNRLYIYIRRLIAVFNILIESCIKILFISCVKILPGSEKFSAICSSFTSRVSIVI